MISLTSICEIITPGTTILLFIPRPASCFVHGGKGTTQLPSRLGSLLSTHLVRSVPPLKHTACISLSDTTHLHFILEKISSETQTEDTFVLSIATRISESALLACFGAR